MIDYSKLAYKVKPKKKKIPKTKSGKIRRLHKKVNKLSSPGFGKKWSGNFLMFRVETFLEDEELNQENLEIHWIQVREFSKKERNFYHKYMAMNGKELKPGEFVEVQYLQSYLLDYRTQNNYQDKFNVAFIFPANKKKDKNIKQPILEIRWNENAYIQDFHAGVAAVYESTIWHETEEVS